MKMGSKINEMELIEDTKELLEKNNDAMCETPEIQKTIEEMSDNTLVLVTKTINSPIVITSVKEVDEELVKSL